MKKLLTSIPMLLGSFALQAQNPVFQASLTPEIAIYSSTTEIRGLSLHIWGENPQQGLTLGLVNGSTGDSSGFTWGLFNYTDSYTGVSWGLCNVSRLNYVGWQQGWINISFHT